MARQLALGCVHLNQSEVTVGWDQGVQLQQPEEDGLHDGLYVAL
jgi:hypothetical protein